eukprot:gb/GECG01010830.1/.p1 GENE.gb/GECG01010830.1/~~gb/GECG01010830.1/.p1  ORF type:complete len:145 (+),score=4.16 gb/GECG01010830.1/:1-435(+)
MHSSRMPYQSIHEAVPMEGVRASNCSPWARSQLGLPSWPRRTGRTGGSVSSLQRSSYPLVVSVSSAGTADSYTPEKWNGAIGLGDATRKGTSSNTVHPEDETVKIRTCLDCYVYQIASRGNDGSSMEVYRWAVLLHERHNSPGR